MSKQQNDFLRTRSSDSQTTGFFVGIPGLYILTTVCTYFQLAQQSCYSDLAFIMMIATIFCPRMILPMQTLTSVVSILQFYN